MRLLLFIGICILTLTACRDDFSLDAPFQDIPVIYAYLNAADQEHFVRVEKAFLGTGGNAEIAASTEDSIYYTENAATVTLQSSNGQEFVLERVNGEDFDLERVTGPFIGSPNVLYRTTQNLTGGQPITLTVSRPGEEDAVATTRLLTEINVVQPSEQIVINNYNQVQNYRWNTSEDARVFDVRMYINIREFFLSNPDQNRDRVLEWVLAENFRPEEMNSTVRLSFNNELFWQFLANSLEEDADVVRVMGDISFQVTAVGSELEEKLDIENANTGITGSQALPIYTNVENGLGIFTSRRQATVEGIFFANQNRDTLLNGVYTRNLNFQ
ncbi:MAG: hypothetical protein AAFU67_03860 [Bacteroidota bacterium]